MCICSTYCVQFRLEKSGIFSVWRVVPCPLLIIVLGEIIHLGRRKTGCLMLDLTELGDMRATWWAVPTIVWEVSIPEFATNGENTCIMPEPHC